MYITITSIRLKSLWHFFPLSSLALKNALQLKKSKGLLAFRKTGIGHLHFTITAWESLEDLKTYATSGAHAHSMKSSARVAKEITSYTYESTEIPDWKNAKQLLLEKGRVLKF